jgi:hypothetical protein
LYNPFHSLQQDAQRFDQNSKTLESVPVIGDLIKGDPFYTAARDGIYQASGVPVAPGQWAQDALSFPLTFLAPGAGKVLEWAGFKGGESVLAGNIAEWTNYTIGARIWNNTTWIEYFVSNGLVDPAFEALFPCFR